MAHVGERPTDQLTLRAGDPTARSDWQGVARVDGEAVTVTTTRGDPTVVVDGLPPNVEVRVVDRSGTASIDRSDAAEETRRAVRSAAWTPTHPRPRAEREAADYRQDVAAKPAVTQHPAIPYETRAGSDVRLVRCRGL